jgi:phosphohistidine phosphatase SixA
MRILILFLSIFVALSAASAEPFVIIVRHAERDNNDPKDPDISEAGRARAEALAKILKDSRIRAIFVTEFKRTQETALPISKSTGIAPIVVEGQDIPGLMSKLHQLSGNALVIAHGNTIPDIIKAIGIDSRVEIPDEDYTDFFVVTLGNKPQLLQLRYP